LRATALLLVLAIVPIQAQTAPTVAQPSHSWDRAKFAEPVRARVHLTTEELPALALEDSLLADPARWPAAWAFGATTCSLHVQMVVGEALISVPSFRDVRPGVAFGLSYACSSEEEAPGPHYIWSRSRALLERYWLTPDSDRAIVTGRQYYLSGEPLRYYQRNDSKDPEWADPIGPYEWYEEFFDRAGNLLGCGYAKMTPDRERDLACYWAGEEISHDRYRTLKRELYAAAFP
jgi:hypothetical protein